MVLTMARAWQDPKTGILHLRQRTPADLLTKVRGLRLGLPVGDIVCVVRIGDVVQVSLRTKDRQKAKELHAAADAALRRFWDAQRHGPSKLTTKDAAALAGTLYRSVLAAASNDPGPASVWRQVEALNGQARAGIFGNGLEIHTEETAREARYGAWADALLTREGLFVDDASRAKLVEAVQGALEHAAVRLRANAEFDYSPDGAAARFPEWVPKTPTAAQGRASERPGVAALFEVWADHHVALRSANTIKRYAASFRSLAAFAGDKAAAELTGDDLHAWAERRRDRDGIKPRSINQNDLVAASSVFRWAASREGGRRMPSNPAQGVSLSEPRASAVREKSLRAGEIAAILRAALAVEDSAANPTAAFAQRWCPWLAAYTGARITELTRLRGTDVRYEGGVAVIDFRKTKTGQPRTVPVHEHLADIGFLRFAEVRGALPLFYDPSRHDPGSTTDPAEVRSRKVAQWVRDTVRLDPAVQPDHAWRHTWKTRALGADIDPRLRDAITGHSARTVARGYEHPSIEMLAAAVRRFPRYEI